MAKNQKQVTVSVKLELETAAGLGRALKLSPWTIRRLGWRGRIREYRCGRSVRYCAEEVLHLMKGTTEKET